MAIVTGPLFSLTGRQSVGKTLVFYRWRGLNLTRQWVKPKNPQTPAQVAHRALFTAAAVHWRDLAAATDKAAYALLAAQNPAKYTSYSAFMTTWLAVADLEVQFQAIVCELTATLATSSPWALTIGAKLYNLAGTLKTATEPTAHYGKTPSTTEGTLALTNIGGTLSASGNMSDGEARYVRLVLPEQGVPCSGIALSVAP